MRLRRDGLAFGGFFEEIPAFTVVVVSVSLFLVTAYTVYGSATRDREAGSMQDDCQRFLLAFRSYDGVLERGAVSREPRNGDFDESRLGALNLSVLQTDLNSPHHWNITVRDLVTNLSWSFGRPLPSRCTIRVSVGSAVVATTDEGRHHPGRLEVVIWR
jgi:hypothetical protein